MGRRRVRSNDECFSLQKHLLPKYRSQQHWEVSNRGYLSARSSWSRVFPVFIMVSLTAIVHGQSFNYASNCYEVGGGSFIKCTGCQYVEAFECLQAMRSNASGNVPFGCRMDVLTVEPEPDCCPVFIDPSIHTTLDMSTSAYPDAIFCLEDVGCRGEKLHAALISECRFNRCDGDFSCVATYSGSSRVAHGPALGLVVVTILMLTLVE